MPLSTQDGSLGRMPSPATNSPTTLALFVLSPNPNRRKASFVTKPPAPQNSVERITTPKALIHLTAGEFA